MPRRPELNRILVLGSGPIVIGQAAEFDYAGTQACRALAEEGVDVILINSNPATIMTDPAMAAAVYLEPLTVPSILRVIERERPQAILPTLGGQTALNLGVALAESGELDRLGIELLCSPLETIRRAEDRELFRSMLRQLGQPVPDSEIVHTVDEALAAARRLGFPTIVRPAFTLGGTGGGIAKNEDDLTRIAERGLSLSPIHQCLVEECVLGWKEIEYEVMRDGADNAIIICNMENLDPMGVHTGDSIVVAPSQTLSDRDYQMLRTASLTIIRALGVQGGCNIQFALDPNSERYHVIEVNPRVSRSSALASKATGYPIARIAAKVALGYRLDELTNPITGRTSAAHEPALDYVVVKMPRWPFDKFPMADRRLGTQMKATGEVMAIGRTFEEALLKSVRSLDVKLIDEHIDIPSAHSLDDATLRARMAAPDDERLFLLAEAIRRGIGIDDLHAITHVDRWFLDRIASIVAMERELDAATWDASEKNGRTAPVATRAFFAGEPSAPRGLIWRAKRMGFSDKRIARAMKSDALEVRRRRTSWGILPTFKMVDTCAAEFEAATPYYYSTYEQEDEARPSGKPTVLVLGSGPIRIGQGIEFDYSTVHAVWALRESGYDAVIVNNNPETVSTDFNTADRLYFEPLTLEDVLNVIDVEKPIGVIAQFGGQTALNLVKPLTEAGIPLLGTSARDIHRAEDREEFEEFLTKHGLPRPPAGIARTVEEALTVASRVGYPVLARPSYVLGGRAMRVLHDTRSLADYASLALAAQPGHPVLVDRFIEGIEVEIDAISDGEHVLIPGIMEHLEPAGVHSGDSSAWYPPRSLRADVIDRLVELTRTIALGLNTKGLLNIQFVVPYSQRPTDIAILEVNPRASRTVPFLSKVTGVPMASVATKAILGQSLKQQGWPDGLWPATLPGCSIKAPVFSFGKLTDVDPTVGPEMKSTGEMLAYHSTPAGALRKVFETWGLKLNHSPRIILSDTTWPAELTSSLKQACTRWSWTLRFIGGDADQVAWNDFQPVLREGSVSAVLLRADGQMPTPEALKLARASAERGILVLTQCAQVQALVESLSGDKAHAMDQPFVLRSGVPLSSLSQ